MLAIQQWLQQGQYGRLKKCLYGLIASHQEAAARELLESVNDPRKVADAKVEADKAADLVKIIETLDLIRDGKMELPITKISIKE